MNAREIHRHTYTLRAMSQPQLPAVAVRCFTGATPVYAVIVTSGQ